MVPGDLTDPPPERGGKKVIKSLACRRIFTPVPGRRRLQRSKADNFFGHGAFNFAGVSLPFGGAFPPAGIARKMCQRGWLLSRSP